MAHNEVILGRGNVDGMFYHAPAGTDLPASPAETPGAAWTEGGRISEDGITFAVNHDFEFIRDWAKKIQRRRPSDDPGTVAAPIITSNEESFKVLFGDDAVSTTAATTSHGNLTMVDIEDDTMPEPEAYLFIGKDGDDSFMLATQSGVLQTIDDIDFDPENAITWAATFAADHWKLVFDDGQTS